MSDLAAEIAEYARNVCRANKGRPIKRDELIAQIMQDAAHNPAWPRAEPTKWRVAIEEAVQRGLLNRDSETLWIPATTTTKKNKLTQQNLF